MTLWFPSRNRDVGKHWASGDRELYAFRQQFHDEGGLRMFRMGGRGAPFPVSELDEDRAVEKFQRGKRLVFAIPLFLAVVVPFLASMILPFKLVMVATYAAMASCFGFLIFAPFWVRRMAVAHIVRRAPVGEQLGLMGSWMRRAEQAPWSQIVFAIASLPVTLFVLKGAQKIGDFDQTEFIIVCCLIGFAYAASAGLTLIKLLQLVRRRHLARLGHRDGWRSRL